MFSLSIHCSALCFFLLTAHPSHFSYWDIEYFLIYMHACKCVCAYVYMCVCIRAPEFSNVWLYHGLLNHPHFSGYLLCFHIFAVANSASSYNLICTRLDKFPDGIVGLKDKCMYHFIKMENCSPGGLHYFAYIGMHLFLFCIADSSYYSQTFFELPSC